MRVKSESKFSNNSGQEKWTYLCTFPLWLLPPPHTYIPLSCPHPPSIYASPRNLALCYSHHLECSCPSILINFLSSPSSLYSNVIFSLKLALPPYFKLHFHKNTSCSSSLICFPSQQLSHLTHIFCLIILFIAYLLQQNGKSMRAEMSACFGHCLTDRP